MIAAEPAICCVVDGRDRDATGPPVVFGGIHVLLCPPHRADFDTDPEGWDGQINPTGTVVECLWRPQGIGSAS